MKVVVDTSVLVDIINPRDHCHNQAMALHDSLIAGSIEVIYFDCVAAEAISVLARRLEEQNRREEIKTMLDRLAHQSAEESLCWILPDAPRLFQEALGSSALRPAC